MKDFSLCARGKFIFFGGGGGMRRRDGRGGFSNWGGSELGKFCLGCGWAFFFP